MKPSQFDLNSPGIPVYEFIEEGSIDLWLSVSAAIFNLSPINREDAKKAYHIASWYVDPISIANSRYEAMVNDHSRWHVEETGDQIHVHKYVRGRSTLESAGIPVESETGSITLLDFSRPFSALSTAADCQSFFVPHTAINYQPSDANHSPVYSETSALGRLIGQEMDNLMDQVKSGARSVDPADIRRFLGCVELGMSPQNASQSAREQARASLKLAIMKFIERRLALPDLSVVLILQNFGVARASLYRMFDAEDGVRNYIRRRRLYRAVSNIAENPFRRGQIHAAAERWGFTSDASFNRMVRSEFGVAPGSLFEIPLRERHNLSSLSDAQRRMIAAARAPNVAA